MNKRERTLRLLWGALVSSLIAVLCGQSATAQTPVAPFTDFSSYVQWMQKHHKAPFDRDGAVMPQGARQALMKSQAAARAARAATPALALAYRNVQVNQDRNPWPKAEVAAAVDPTQPSNWVVMTNDFRENYDKMFFHVSTNNGEAWSDDAMVGGNNPFTGFIPSTFQSDPGLSFDGSGNSYLSTITGNLIIDFASGYENVDTEIDVAQGFAGGTYADLLPTAIDVQPCHGLIFVIGGFTCDATLDKPLITTDSDPSSPNSGTTYVYYTLFCNFPLSGVCTDGTATVPFFQSGIVESHSAAPGLPFSPPALVSGPLVNTQFSDLVIDSAGTPHMFFDDFTNFPIINMWESTLVGGSWVVSAKPVVSFIFNGLRSINLVFRSNGAEAPGCGIHGFTAYCAFSANQVVGGRAEASPSVYLAAVDTTTGTASHVVRVNNDLFGNQKDHFFAWATATPNGHVYVGWYDDRNDPFNTKVDYFVARSTDAGKSFPTQKPVNDVSFNPCVGFPGCGFFGDYTQLVSGSDGVVHAAWSDTRDGASMQLWSQAINWDNE